MDDAVRWFHRNYGADLPAFFRDAFEYQKTGVARASVPKPPGPGVKPTAVRAAGG